MKTRSIFRAIIFCISVLSFNAQELVPNGGFEVISNCPVGPGQLHYALGWSHATSLASTDFYHKCGSYFPNISGDFQNSHSGQGIAGFFAYDVQNGSMAREFLQVQLNDTLEPGKSYHCKMYLNLSNYSAYAVNSVGMYFTPNAIFSTTVFTVPNPQVQNPVNVFLSDTMNWMLLEDTIVAAGGELFLTIGNFHPDSSTDTLRVWPYGAGADIAYYYIDDISVMPLSIGVEEHVRFDMELLPNPSQGLFTLRKLPVALKRVKLSMLSAEGRIIEEELLDVHNRSVTFQSKAPPGFYMLRIADADGEQGFGLKKVIVQ